MAEEGRVFAYQPDDCPHGSWARNGIAWTCQLCGAERQTRAVPSNQRNIPCVYCGSPGLTSPTHVYGERKCCPDCEHRATATQPIRDALIEVLAARGLGPEARLIAAELMPVVAGIAADALRAEADELRELALRCEEDERWNPHRVWTLLSDRADVWRERMAR